MVCNVRCNRLDPLVDAGVVDDAIRGASIDVVSSDIDGHELHTPHMGSKKRFGIPKLVPSRVVGAVTAMNHFCGGVSCAAEVRELKSGNPCVFSRRVDIVDI